MISFDFLYLILSNLIPLFLAIVFVNRELGKKGLFITFGYCVLTLIILSFFFEPSNGIGNFGYLLFSFSGLCLALAYYSITFMIKKKQK